MFKQKGSSGVEILIQIVLTGILCIVIFGISAIWRSYQCHSYGDLTNRDTKYTITNGCFVKFEDKFIPRSELERRYIMNSEESK